MTTFQKSKLASKELQKVVPNKINRLLKEIADELIEQSATILNANALDVADADQSLELTIEHLEAIADELREIAQQPSPLGKILVSSKRPNDMTINRVSAPYGVIGVVYDDCPCFTLSSFALCFKSGNAIILQSGNKTQRTNQAIVTIIREYLDESGVNANTLTLLKPDSNSTLELLHATGLVDLIIPRGDMKLIKFIRENAHIPYIETGRGVTHIYIDNEADIAKAESIVHNAKTRSPRASNSLDCLVVHESQIEHLPTICSSLLTSEVTIYADPKSFTMLEDSYPHLIKATQDHFETEYLCNSIAIKTVKSLAEAIAHINHHSAQHSDAIITENCESSRTFLNEIDSACVYSNVSPAFTDGAQFGMGAEIGISTQKHGVRGPLGLTELTTYKYQITGDSQIRE